MCFKWFLFSILSFMSVVQAQVIPVEDIFSDLLSNLTLVQVNIDNICESIKSLNSEGDICLDQLRVVCDNVTFRSTMLDASSKFPYSGMLFKTRYELGTYDECVRLDLKQNGTHVIGKHCSGGLIIPDPNVSRDDPKSFESAFKLSTCIPDQCTAEGLLSYLNLSNVYPLFNDYTCFTKNSFSLSAWKEYFVVSLFVLIGLIMLIATLLELHFMNVGKENTILLVRAFSVYGNGKKLLQISRESNEQIRVMHGLRAISTIWIVAAHSYSTMNSFPGSDINFLTNFEWNFRSTYITTGHLAVDTFFFMSGFLLAYQYLKMKPTSLSNHLKRIPGMILHRYIRIVPVLVAVFLVVVILLGKMGDGPLYLPILRSQTDKCENHWWSFFLFVQNYVHYQDLCLTHTWYLSADWQLFMISPIVMIPVALLVKNHFKKTMALLAILNVLFTIIPMAIKLLYPQYDNEYETHSRLNDYFIGLMLGVFMRNKIDMKYKISQKTNIFIWTVVMIGMVATIIGYKKVQLLAYFNDDASYDAYYIVLRAVWCSCIGYVIFACHKGYGGPVNRFLTISGFQFLSKLTYCLYLLHPLPMTYLHMITRNPIEYGQLTALKGTIMGYFLTLPLSLLWTLAFESPMITLEKFIFRR